jgi:hypothetical protein
MVMSVNTPNTHTNQFLKKKEKEDMDKMSLIEESETTIRIPISNRQSSDVIRTIQINPNMGITALYATNRKTILTYLFSKSKHTWTIESSKNWVKDHR